jgi:hypothetical protein
MFEETTMKKKNLLLLLSAVTLGTFFSFAQSGLDVRYDPDGATGPLATTGSNLAGGSHSISLYPGSPDLAGGVYEVHFIVTNTNNTDKQYKIIRKQVNVPATWIDQVCWPPLCYNASGSVYSTPHTASNPAPIIVAGSELTTTGLDAELKPRITPDQSAAGYALYRYYFYDVQGGGYVDSVDLSIGFVLGVNQQKADPAMVVMPNPADNHASVTINSEEATPLKVVDALGKTVLTETIYNGSKSLDVSDLKNGVYFILIESEGKMLNRKLIVRH